MGGIDLKKVDEEEEKTALQQEKKRKILAVVAMGVISISFYGWWRKTETSSPAILIAKPDVVEASKKSQGDVVVYVSGLVEHPGVVRINGGARVIDAVNAAGGLLPGAEVSKVNLAQAVRDGMQIHVPGTPRLQQNMGAVNYQGGREAANEPKAPAGSSSVTEEKININTADVTELDKLPGVGPSMAAKIVEWRKTNGSFQDGADLKKVKGIGEAKYQKLKDRISW